MTRAMSERLCWQEGFPGNYLLLRGTSLKVFSEHHDVVNYVLRTDPFICSQPFKGLCKDHCCRVLGGPTIEVDNPTCLTFFCCQRAISFEISNVRLLLQRGCLQELQYYDVASGTRVQ